jgi:catechol 2,3-dioxygenase-like lactoylglutathione lyase family enzyme
MERTDRRRDCPLATLRHRHRNQRFGAKGAGTSVYFRDPDGSLMEFMSYA